MAADPEALLAKYQRDFAAIEHFLQRDTPTPTPPPQRAEQRVDPNATNLHMSRDDDDEDDGTEDRTDGSIGGGGAAATYQRLQNQQQHHRTHNDDRTGDASSGGGGAPLDTSASPAARPPTSRLTSSASAAAVARAIAANGGLQGPQHGPQPHPHHSGGSHGSVPRQQCYGQTWTTHHSASAARRAPSGALDEVDQLIEARLQSAGRYTSTAAPDAMYIKSQAWALRRRQINEALRREQEEAALRDCTFQPQIEPIAGEAESTTVSEAARPPGSDAASLRDDPAVAQHLARQAAARQRRREAQARLDGAGRPKWTGRPTVPQAFELGGRVAEPIPSLRKPCLPEPGAVEPWLAGARYTAAAPEATLDVAFGLHESVGRVSDATSAAAAALRGKKASNSVSRKGGERRPSEKTAAVRRRPNAPSVPQTEGHAPLIAAAVLSSPSPRQQEQQQQQQNGSEGSLVVLADSPCYDVVRESAVRSNSSSGSSDGGHDDAPSRDLVRRLSDQLAHKDAIIDAQMEDLDRLHRELEAVKETLQQIASLGIAQR